MKSQKVFGYMAYTLGGVYAILFLFAAALRLVYPYEVEWNEGAVLDHALRVLHGLPIYTTPSLDFAAFVYTPLYYYVTALAMKIGGIGLWAPRAVSIISTLGTAFIIAFIIYREASSSSQRSLLFPISGAMLYLAFYHATGFFYDIARMDALAVLLVAASVYIAMYIRRGYLAAAVLAALAYFTKQQMIFIWPAIGIYFFLRKKRDATWFAALSIAFLILGTVILNGTTDGWYRFYTFTIPSAKAAANFSWRDALEFFPKWMFGSLGFFTLIILFALLVSRDSSRSRNFVMLLLATVLAMASASLSFGNPGGYDNVIMPLAALIAILFTLCVGRIAERFQKSPSVAPLLLLLSFLALAYNPLGERMLFASNRQRKAGDEFIAALRKIPGDVWVPFHGYISTLAGKPTHIHFMAMNDALVPHDDRSTRFQREIDSSLAIHRFSAIILDEERVYGWDSLGHYSRDGQIFKIPNVFLSRIGSAPTRPQFIYLPAQ